MDREYLKGLRNELKILYILAERGSATFTEILNLSGLSKKTVSKYLLLLLDRGYIEKRILTGYAYPYRSSDSGYRIGMRGHNRSNSRTVVGYTLTEAGSRKFRIDVLSDFRENWHLNLQDRIDELEWLRARNLIEQRIYDRRKTALVKIEDSFFNLLNNALNILEFGEELGKINEITASLGRFAAKFGESFFKKAPDLIRHLAVLFIFFNLLENPQFHTTLDVFIETYGKIDDNFGRYSETLLHARRFLTRFTGTSDFIKELETVLIRKIYAGDGSDVYNFDLLTSNLKENLAELLVDKYGDKINLEMFPITNLTRIGSVLISGFYGDFADPEEVFRDRMIGTEGPEIPSTQRSDMRITDGNVKIWDSYDLADRIIAGYSRLFSIYFKLKRDLIMKTKSEIEGIIKGDYGLIQFTVNFHPYYFHERDSVGTYLFRRIDDRIAEQIINKRIFGMHELTPLVEIAEEITHEMLTMHMIWEEIADRFKDVVLTLIYKRANLLGLRKGSDEEKINFEEIRGFCPKCGYRILTGDGNECEFCKTAFGQNDLIYDINEARKIREKYKAMKTESFTGAALLKPCPRCGFTVGQNWARCPRCKTNLQKKTGEPTG